MQKGNIGVTTENIFPIIKKFLYSEHEIFLRELVSNAIDATQKMKAASRAGDFTGDLGELKIWVSFDKDAKTITIKDRGIGMTQEEIDKYINQIAFSSANEFLDKYKNDLDAIIGHFGLGFYSSFMVSERVDIITKSWKEGSQAVKWSCDGSPEYTLEEVEKEDRGTEIVLHLDKDSHEFADQTKLDDLLTKFCKFLPVEIAFGKEQEWKEDKYVDTDVDKIINNPEPAWKKKPADLTDEDYSKFYKELYPATYEDPLFNIHLNVDYPFNLTGVLYFPKIRSNIEIQKNKIQLYCNQVYVTDSVEGIVPDFLTLLHGVIDSPDIPLNVSRSYLQGDPNVKKISSHITKKVADRLQDIFKSDREQFEKKWDDLKMFIAYGIVTDDKFYDKAKKFSLLKNVDGKCFTFDEYETLIKPNQTDKDNKVVYLYTTNKDDQYSYIQAAKDKGYDVLVLDGHLDSHLINTLENKLTDARFARVDSEVVGKLIPKDEKVELNLSSEEQNDLRPVIKSQLPESAHFLIMYEGLTESELPVMITQTEFMRRMKDMQQVGGGGFGMGDFPDSYNLVVNGNHPLVSTVLEQTKAKVGEEVAKLRSEQVALKEEKSKIEEGHKDLKEEEVPQADKDKLAELDAKIEEVRSKKESVLEGFGKQNDLVKQMVDLALLANGMLKGEPLTKFVKRSVDLIKA